MQEISHSENPDQFTELPNSWEERGIRKGIEQGLNRDWNEELNKQQRTLH